MFKIKPYLVLFAALSMACSNTLATPQTTPPQEPSLEEQEAAFKQWIKDFIPRAQSQGITQQLIDQVIRNANFVPRVIELDRRQPHATKTFDQYVELVVPQSRIDRAHAMYEENRVLLEEIGTHYGVQPRFIVALWGIESDFGRNMGGFSIIDSLATLAFEGRRATFFEKELIHALRILDEQHISVEDMKGSWAGAMGQTQFMPSSFVSLAVDHDGDTRRDIWGTKADIFGSIANYLAKTGWDDTTTWGREVLLPAGFDKELIGRSIEKSLEQWRALGVQTIDGTPLPDRSGLVASLIRPEDDKERTYLVYNNYKTLLKWNRSLYFATGVGILSDHLKGL